MTVTDERTDLDIDLTREVPCGAVTPCDRTAVWLGTLHHTVGGACQTLPTCDRCRDVHEDLMATHAISCVPHGASANDVTWRPL